MSAKPGPRAGRALVVLLAALALLPGCAERVRDPRPGVVVSILPLAFFVERIAGERVRVEVMLPPGASPATYEPTLEQLRAVAEAALFVKVGHEHLSFERTWLEDLLADYPGLPVVDSTQAVGRDRDDPHVWLSPARVRVLAERLEEALAPRVPADAVALAANRRRFQAEIDELDAEIRGLLAQARGHRFFVFHPAWGYFADDYGLVQVAIEQEGKAPDVRRLAHLMRQAREAQVTVIFSSPQFDAASAEVVAAEVGARVESLDPLARDWIANLRHVARRIAAAAVP